MSGIIEETLRIEGGYVNDPDDRGWETYKGISRRWHPSWDGWETVDRYKTVAENVEMLDRLLAGNTELQKMVQGFYRTEYLVPFDAIDSDEIRAELFDTAANTGTPKSSTKLLQRALNLMNRNGKTFPDLYVDGAIGPKTLEAYEKSDKAVLLKVLNGLQFMHYVEVAENDPRQEKFFNGWMKRV
jgi:lysozyme family protein